jgi:hypothetical protein
MMITIQAVIDRVKSVLPAPYDDYLLQPGINLPAVPIPFSMFSRLEGSGLEVEGVLDGIGVRVETVGQQHDYTSGEAFALAIDRAMLSPLVDYKIGSVHVANVDRFGGGPYEFEYDDANRYHFVCSYILAVQSGIAVY